MGAKAKKVGPSRTEQLEASVAVDRQNFFRQNYNKLLKEQRNFGDKKVGNMLRGRAAADVQQQLSNSSYGESMRSDAAGDSANALLGNLGVASTNATAIENRMATNTIGTAQQQASDATTGLSAAARISSSDALNRAKNKQMVAQAKLNAGAQLATAGVMRAGSEGLFGNKVAGTINGPSTPSSKPSVPKLQNKPNPYSIAGPGYRTVT
jgi:hypothetical protein